MSRVEAKRTSRCVQRRVGRVAYGQYLAETDRYWESPGKRAWGFDIVVDAKAIPPITMPAAAVKK